MPYTIKKHASINDFREKYILKGIFIFRKKTTNMTHSKGAKRIFKGRHGARGCHVGQPWSKSNKISREKKLN